MTAPSSPPAAAAEGTTPSAARDRVRPELAGPDRFRRSIAANTTLLIVSQAVTWLLGFFVMIALPRHLGPTLLGQLRLGLSLWAVAAVVVAAGTHLLLTREFARDPATATSMIGSATVLQLLAYLASWLGVGVFAAIAGYGTQTLVIIAMVGLSIAFTPVSGTARAVLYGLERMEYIALSDVATKALYVVTVLGMIMLGLGVEVIAGASIVYGAASAGMLWWALRRLGVSWHPTFTGLRRVGRRSRSYMLSDVTLIAYQQIDVIVISLLVQPQALGWYSTADGLFGSLLFLPSILMTALFPVFSRLHATATDELRDLLRGSFELLLVIAVPIGFGTLAIASPAAVLLFGQEFAGTGPVLAVMGLVLTLTYLTILLGRYALATGRQAFWIRLMVAATVATVALDLVLVPWSQRALDNGAVGGAVAYLVTEAVMLAVGIRVLAPWLACRSTARRAVLCLFAGATMLAVIWPLRWTALPLPIAAGAATYIVMLVMLRILTADEVSLLRSAVARTRTGMRRATSKRPKEVAR